MCYTTGILKKQQQGQQHDASSGSGGTSRIASSNSLRSLPKRAESPASSTSSSSSESEILESESAEFESAGATSTTNYNYKNGGGGRQFHASNGANGALAHTNGGTESSSSSPNNLTVNNHTTSHHHYYQLASFLLVLLVAIFVLHFSLWFPFVLPYQIGSAAYHTYEPAWYMYDVVHTKFDNTVWTYGTDYILTLVMCYLAWRCWNVGGGAAGRKNGTTSSSFQLRLYSSSLLLCYGLSTLAGGLAHQYFTSLQLLNTTNFQWLWTICVGNVAFASGYMGLIGREVQRIFGVKNGKGVEVVPLGPWWFWPAYGTFMAGAVAMGYMSFKRPACDIFIAGITQFPTTFYCLGALGLRKWPSSSAVSATNAVPVVSSSSSTSSSTTTTSTSSSTAIEKSPSLIGHVHLPYRIMYYVGFIGNAPLLPMYPLLVQYSGMSLAGINTLLHSWLMIMWGMQGISLLHLLNAIELHHHRPKKD